MSQDKSGGTFSAPRRSTRWIKASAAGGDAAEVKLEADGAYVSLDLIDLKLGRAGLPTSKFHALFVSDLSVSTQAQTQLRQSALIDPRNVKDGIRTVDGGKHDPAVTSICAQMPWQGQMSGELHVLALRSEAMLKAMLALNDKLMESLPKGGGQPPPGEPEDEGDEGHESVLLAAMAGKVASKFLKKIGYTAAVEVARLLNARDGTYETRLRVNLKDLPAQAPLSAGYYVMLPGGKAAGSAELDFGNGGGAPVLRVNGKRVSGRDYAVVHVMATTHHQNIEDVPMVGDAWTSLQRVLESGGHPDEALNAFRRVVAISPYLIGADRERLNARAVQMVDAVRPYLQAPQVGAGADGHESLARNPLVKLAFRTLKEAWNAGVLSSGPDAAPKAAEPKAAPKAETGKAAPEPAAPLPPKLTTADRFETAITFCLRWEGGYSDHPSDKGGKTNYGITEKVFHEWLESRGEAQRPVKEITKAEARAIYWSDYWLAAQCNRLKRQLDLVMFDTAVNSGPGGAAKLLQRALNALAGEAGEKIKVDGAIGGKTHAALANYETRAVCAQYLTERRALFDRIVKADATQEAFLKGWRNRVADLEKAIGEGGSHSDYESVGGEITPQNTPFAKYVD